MILQIEQHEQDGWLVVSTVGEIDVPTSAQFRDVLHSAVHDGFANIIVDFSSLESLDSTGLGVLVGALKKMRDNNGGDIMVAVPTGRIAKMFEATGLIRVFPMFESVEDALASSKTPLE